MCFNPCASYPAAWPAATAGHQAHLAAECRSRGCTPHRQPTGAGSSQGLLTPGADRQHRSARLSLAGRRQVVGGTLFIAEDGSIIARLSSYQHLAQQNRWKAAARVLAPATRVGRSRMKHAVRPGSRGGDAIDEPTHASVASRQARRCPTCTTMSAAPSTRFGPVLSRCCGRSCSDGGARVIRPDCITDEISNVRLRSTKRFTRRR